MSHYLDNIRRMSNYQRLVYWIKERERIRVNRVKRRKKPWTDDPILQQYKFCNVCREDDRVTRWIARNWRTPNATDPYLFFAMAVARFINWPNTLDRIGYPVPWKRSSVTKKMEDLEREGKKIWTGAYMVSTNGVPTTKIHYVLDRVLDPLWQQRKELTPQPEQTLADYAVLLKQQFGLSGFMVGQVIADLKYVQPLLSAMDWSTWAISGPGSRRGMNRLLGRELTAPWKEPVWRTELGLLQHKITTETNFKLHAQDLQNCLCEYDKYERVLFGQGRPRSKYPGV